MIASNDDYAFHYHVKPSYPPKKFVEKFEYRVNVILLAKIIPVFYFDGQDHCMKWVARKQRVDDKAKANAKLDALEKVKDYLDIIMSILT